MTEPEEGFAEADLIPVICHNCNKPMRLVERNGNPEQFDYDQCDECSALPINPQPPLHHLEYVERQNRESCNWCQASKELCDCKFCPSCEWWFGVVDQTACNKCGTSLISLKEAYERGLQCLACGRYPLSHCGHEPDRESATNANRSEAMEEAERIEVEAIEEGDPEEVDEERPPPQPATTQAPQTFTMQINDPPTVGWTTNIDYGNVIIERE